MESRPHSSIDSLPKPNRLQLPFNDVERTLNQRGFMYTLIGPSATHWLRTSPALSHLPLLDLGAAYGVHTLHALRAGRDVVALDADARHLQILQARVKALGKGSVEQPAGKLVRTVQAWLPDRDAVGAAEVAGVLLSEVLHFLHPRDAVPLFRDVWHWLAVGGVFVVTTGSSEPRMETLIRKGFVMGRGLEEEEVGWDRGKEEIVGEGRGYARVPEEVRGVVGDFLYMLSVGEVEEMARLAGFEVERCEYVTTGKHGDGSTEPELDTVMLVARKVEGKERLR